MRQLCAIVAVAVAAGVCFAGQAQASLVGCFGAPADYRAAFDTVRGQSTNGQVDYPYPTVYIEFQGWITTNNPFVLPPGHHSEHLHGGACFPQGETLTDANAKPWYVDVKWQAHNVRDYKATVVQGSLVDFEASTGAITATQAQLDELTAAFAASADTTVTVFQSYRIAVPLSNGIKELRFGLHTERSGPSALVDRWRFNGRVYFTYNYAGLPSHQAKAENVRFIRTQNWVFYTVNGVLKESYNYAGFASSGAWKRGTLTPARPASWDVAVRTTDGTNQGLLAVNPNFHQHPDNLGSWYTEWSPSGDDVRTFTVPLGTLGLPSLSVNRLFLRGDEYPEPYPNPSVKPVSSSVVVLPFRAP